jgi:hypothetical protein
MFVNPKDMSDDELAYCYDTNPDPAHIAAGTPEYQQWVREIQEEYERRFLRDFVEFWEREVKFACDEESEQIRG